MEERMPYSKLTSKGQITIPKAVREVLGLEQGDRVAFRIGEDGVVVVEPQTVELLSLRGRLKPRRGGVTAEEMDTAIRKGARGR
jgi:antitoxin PrlF